MIYTFVNKKLIQPSAPPSVYTSDIPDLFVPVYGIRTIINEDIFNKAQEDYYGRAFVIGAMDNERPFLVYRYDKARYWDAKMLNDSCGEWMTSPNFLIGLKTEVLRKDGLYTSKTEEYLSRLAKQMQDANKHRERSREPDLTYRGDILQGKDKEELPSRRDDIIRVRAPQGKIILG